MRWVRSVRRVLVVCFVALSCLPLQAQQRETGSVEVKVTSGQALVEGAHIQIGGARATTSAAGVAILQALAGASTLVVGRDGYIEKSLPIVVVAGQTTSVTVELDAAPTITEEVVVTATRSDKRIQDEPLRVEVLGREEIEEKMLMTPGDIAMLLSETTGLRVQVTSPGLGAASLRVQGLRGRYTQLLADGLPLYGGQSGSIGLLQIPPMDLGQVEVIKGVASSLFGASALGGVVNLVSRRPPAEAEYEMLINQTTQAGTNAVAWFSGPIRPHWGYTLLTGVDYQHRQDVDDDGWADVAAVGRVSARPRVYWDNGAGRSLLMTVGAMFEDRDGGTLPGRTVPDGSAFPQSLETLRTDGGVVGRFLIGQKMLGVRGSVSRQAHTHVFGDATERDRHATGFGEVSLTGVRGAHTWVIGTAVQADAYRGLDVTGFDYTYWAPSAFAQDDFVVSDSVSLSGSVRLDRHSEFGVFFSPRLSALFKAGGGWTARVSGGTGYFAPTPLTEETEAAGLTRLAPFDVDEAERAQSGSFDLNRTFGALDVNATLFGSRVTRTLVTREVAGTTDRYELVALASPTETVGTELLGRFRMGAATVVASYTYTHSTEPDPVTGIRGDVPITPRHAAGLTAMWEVEGRLRIGVEAYYTGSQQLRDDPYRQSSPAYPYFGALAERAFGRYRLFVNFENLGDQRQTRTAPLVRPSRFADGRWTVDAWGPLEGRVVNGGIRVQF